jgi:predicted phosphodiesterase
MKIGVISDTHSNYHGLKACVNHGIKEGVDRFLFLGDYVSDCGYPQKTMNLLYELKDSYECCFIKGNREEYMLDYKDQGLNHWLTPSSATGSLLYTYENLTERDFEFFRSLPISGRLSISGYPDVLYCHGSMERTKGVLRLGSQEVTDTLKSMDAGVILCGHTHIQGTQEYQGKKLVNVGSAGVPYFYEGKAQYGILHGENGIWEEELLQIDYNKALAVLELQESGLYDKANIWAKLVEICLLTGIDRTKECLDLALQLYKDKEGKTDWPTIPECYWQEAANVLGFLG